MKGVPLPRDSAFREQMIAALQSSVSVSAAAKKLGIAGSSLRLRCQTLGIGPPSTHIGKAIGGPRPVGELIQNVGTQLQEPTVRNREGQRILVISDAHHPHVDQLAWSTVLEAARVLRPDVAVIIGDFTDAECVSTHRKRPDANNLLRDELILTNKALDEVERLRIPRVIYIEGNHEDRIYRYLCDRAPELFGLVDVKGLLGIERRGFEWVPYGDSIKIGRVYLTHDVGRAGKNAAMQSLSDFGHPLVIGHTHRLATVYQGTVAGERHVCLNVGWLGSYDAIRYRHKNMAQRDWQHGFGWVVQDETGLSWCQAIPIMDGRCIVDGRIISGRRPS